MSNASTEGSERGGEGEREKEREKKRKGTFESGKENKHPPLVFIVFNPLEVSAPGITRQTMGFHVRRAQYNGRGT